MRKFTVILLAIMLVFPTAFAYAEKASGVVEPYAKTYKGALVVKKPVTQRGETVSVMGRGFVPGTKVEVTYDGQHYQTLTASANGDIQFTYTVGTSESYGIHALKAVGITNRGQGNSTEVAQLELSNNVRVIAKGQVLGEQTPPLNDGKTSTEGKAGSSAGSKSLVSNLSSGNTGTTVNTNKHRASLPFTGGTVLWALLVAGLALVTVGFGLKILKRN